MNRRPTYDVDLYSNEVVVNPYPHYRAIRDLGEAVWLEQHGMWAIGRHLDARNALSAHNIFISGKGVAANNLSNGNSPGNLLASDPPLHTHLRKVVSKPLHPKALARIKPRIEASAGSLIDKLLARNSFDGILDLAQFLPISIVSEMVGLPDAGRRNMLEYAAAVFDLFGVDNTRTEAALPIVIKMRKYLSEQATRDKVLPEGWIAGLYDAVDLGLIKQEQVQTLMRDYLGPSLDTTIFAIGHLLHLFGQYPDQWKLLRQEPNRVGNAINEAIRLESPIRGFTRVLSQDYTIGGIKLLTGDRVLILYASANRDERRWDEPEKFDICRVLTHHVGFGYGIHQCVGMQLARLEMRSILTAMIARVSKIKILGAPVYAKNNFLRGLETLPIKFSR
ncbi:MAG: cytochrome P450 [Planktomarina sp.]|nr:cytochrome P450 [Planktomarina sp.]